MADYRTISSGFWNDPYTEELTPQEKLFYLYLFSCPHTNNAGILHVSPRKMAFETGINSVKPLIKKLCDDGKLVEREGYYWVVNFIKHQSSTSPKIIQSIAKALKSAPVALADMVLKRYNTLSIPYEYPINTPTIPYAELEGERELEKEEEEEEEGEREEGESAKRGSKSEESAPAKSSPLKNPGFSEHFVRAPGAQDDVTWPFFHKNKPKPYKNSESQGVALKQLFELSGGNEGIAKEALTKTISNGYQGYDWYFNRQKEKSEGTQNGRLGHQKPLDQAGAAKVAASIANDPRLE